MELNIELPDNKEEVKRAIEQSKDTVEIVPVDVPTEEIRDILKAQEIHFILKDGVFSLREGGQIRGQ